MESIWFLALRSFLAIRRSQRGSCRMKKISGVYLWFRQWARTRTMDILIQISKTYWPLLWITRITDSLFMLLERRVKWLLVFIFFSPFYDHVSNHIWKFERKKKEFLPEKMLECNLCAVHAHVKKKWKIHSLTLSQWTENHIRFVAFINGKNLLAVHFPFLPNMQQKILFMHKFAINTLPIRLPFCSLSRDVLAHCSSHLTSLVANNFFFFRFAFISLPLLCSIGPCSAITRQHSREYGFYMNIIRSDVLSMMFIASSFLLFSVSVIEVYDSNAITVTVHKVQNVLLN